LGIALDDGILVDLLSSFSFTSLSTRKADVPRNGLMIYQADNGLIDNFYRLLSLCAERHSPEERAALGSIFIREIHARLLLGPAGSLLKMTHAQGSVKRQIAAAVAWLRVHYREPFDEKSLAGRFGMAPSTFNRHFRELAMLSPLQYQKQIRLSEAQRLMLLEGKDAGAASFAVGYESVSQFSREYKRMFGASPAKNIKAQLQGIPL
jgi:AraC-like DNA-binding protein